MTEIITVNGNTTKKGLYANLPVLLANRRLTVTPDYNKGVLIFAVRRIDAPEGVKVHTNPNTKERAFCNFGKTWFDNKKFVIPKQEVQFDGKQFEVAIERKYQRKATKVETRPKLATDKKGAAKALNYLNDFASDNGFDFIVSPQGKLSMRKSEVIE